jgi:hypothetical protein
VPSVQREHGVDRALPGELLGAAPGARTALVRRPVEEPLHGVGEPGTGPGRDGAG